MHIVDYPLMFSSSYILIFLSSCDNWTYNTMAFIRSRLSLQNHGKSIHLKSIWLSSSRLRKRVSSIIPFKETNRRGILFFDKRIMPSAVPHMRWLVHPWRWNHFSCQKKTTGLLMNHAVGGILSTVSVLQERYHLHTVLYHCIVSYRVFVPAVHSFFQRQPFIFFQ